MSTPAVAVPAPADICSPISTGRDTGDVSVSPAKFDAAKHVAYSPPSQILMMKDLALEPTEISPIASTIPFPLLSFDAVLQHRREIFSPEVLDNCLHYVRPGSVQIRGMAPRYAPFIHAFWNSPEVLKTISDIAGVDLVPAMDYEISHTNVQLGPGGVKGVRATPVEPPAATDDAIANFEKGQAKPRSDAGEAKPVIEWHKDSHPFVCVVMLSDARNMQGGETELKCGDGQTMKVRAPQMGYAVILQGAYIEHTALPTWNMPERVTIVTSFRPRDPTLLDDTTNKHTRDESNLTELYYQWTTYRLDVLAQRARIAVEALREKYAENVRDSDKEGKPGMCRRETVNIADVEKWVREQVNYLQVTLEEMRPIEE